MSDVLDPGETTARTDDYVWVQRGKIDPDKYIARPYYSDPIELTDEQIDALDLGSPEPDTKPTWK